jgi:hypothetical protein
MHGVRTMRQGLRVIGIALGLGIGAIHPADAGRATLASEASGQRGDSIVRAPDTRPEPGSSARAGKN